MKLRYDLLDQEFIDGIALVFTHGRNKYPDQELHECPPEKNLHSLLNHVDDLRRGHLRNMKDWGLPTEYHIGARAMMSWIIRTRNEKK